MNVALIGRYLGAFGLLLLLSSPATLFFTSGSPVATAVKAGVGLVLVGVCVATNLQAFGNASARRSSLHLVRSALIVAGALVALVVVNLVASRHNTRWDLTHGKLHSLAPQTVATLEALPEPVHAYGFMPPTHASYPLVEELFQRYQAQAPGRFTYTLKDPRRAPDLAAKYQLKEGQATVVLVRGEGPEASHTTLNVVSEQDLTNALIKLNAVGTQHVYFVTGHGEWPLAKDEAAPDDPGATMSELRRQLLQEGYAAEALYLTGATDVPRDAALLVIAGARVRVSQPEVDVLRRYLAQGGRVLYFADAGLRDGLDDLLAEYGVLLDEGVVADSQFNSGNPYVVQSAFYSAHDIVRPLKQRGLNVELPTARSLSLLRQGLAEGVRVEPLVHTSQNGWVETKPEENAVPSDGEKMGQLTLAAAITRDTKDVPERRFDQARLVVVGDSELLLDPNWGHEPNRNLVMNALGWATNQVAKVTLRPPDRDVSTISLDPTAMSHLRFITTDLLPLTLMGMGLAIWLTRRNQ
ncbi:GldG family protein [Myxococcus sp. K15C18031901]|uniref:GldG family protein n=1 Tax=Myxococcus dinghuensis TaxID=2906761 RepID=UPI0020A6F51E|nr:GldG family protein [Myxococcus dinghuensis]MCP3103867.1 GldG family protein [Myxococcus dinghuensis]